ncbi:hypothetical protein IV498_14770 [Paenarthrobacter sp. Z7-10]|uniref:hypothetical protein n=1 Tax=Paenarthrobacter sp. Z7-10 TaxID=2787635 RepID=UPI0022A90ABF|nr:hypothetical protein [Paenarthrobacter sp. Z7-10]MCZ2404405.1 hypothetical protein [Paenarthrobacter sp. Z7-10]
MSLLGGLVSGAAAGAAGTTALSAVTYLDMLTRARPSSSTPEETVKKLAEATGTQIPGTKDEQQNRVSALGPLTGLAVGIGVGAALGFARAAGLRSGALTTTVLGTLGALAGSNGPMTILGVSDPRSWSVTDWVSDVVPHLAYGAVTAATLRSLDRY